MRNENYDFSRREGDHISYMDIPWTRDIVSEDGAHYHCWIHRYANRIHYFNEFKKAARNHGDPISFSWNYIPEKDEHIWKKTDS